MRKIPYGVAWRHRGDGLRPACSPDRGTGAPGSKGGLIRNREMKWTSIIASAIFALALTVSGDAFAKSGKVEKVENGGRSVTIAGRTYKVSKSRTMITIGGKKSGRGAIKVGMDCDAKGKGTAKTIACK